MSIGDETDYEIEPRNLKRYKQLKDWFKSNNDKNIENLTKGGDMQIDIASLEFKNLYSIQ
jgi:hypothetical protein